MVSRTAVKESLMDDPPKQVKWKSKKKFFKTVALVAEPAKHLVIAIAILYTALFFYIRPEAFDDHLKAAGIGISKDGTPERIESENSEKLKQAGSSDDRYLEFEKAKIQFEEAEVSFSNDKAKAKFREAFSSLEAELELDRTKVLQEAIRTQEELEEVNPVKTPVNGWMYLGDVDKAKNVWDGKQYISGAVPPSVTQNFETEPVNVEVISPVVLRGDGIIEDKRSKAPSLRVMKVGDKAKILELDPRKIPVGEGFALWARVVFTPIVE